MSIHRTCPTCGGLAKVGTTCPKAVACPRCSAPAGSPCRRPSGHRCDVHEARYLLAEAIDEGGAELDRHALRTFITGPASE